MNAANRQESWRVFYRRSRLDQWMEWGGADNEAEALEWLAYVRKQCGHFEAELRKITTTTEVVDA